MIPVFEITANAASVTDAIRSRFVSLSISDAAGDESDQMTLELNDRPDPVTGEQIELPKKGVILEVALGYRRGDQVSVLPAGRWVVDEVSVSGGAGGNKISITANGADFAGSLKEKKTRSWQKITLPGILETLGSEHGLTVKVHPQFALVFFDQLDQTNESDINLFSRLASNLDAVGKIVGDTLVFSPRNSGKNASGQSLATVHLGFPGNVNSWSMKQPSRAKFGSVVASWYDVSASKIQQVKIGSEEPVEYIDKKYPGEAQAREAAEAKLRASKRSGSTLSISGPVPYGTLLQTETSLLVDGLRKGADGRWRVQKAQLSMTTSGFTYSIEAVKPDEHRSSL